MRRIVSKPIIVFYLLAAGLAALVAQQVPSTVWEIQDEQQSEPAAAPAAIAESGLLPVFGAGIELDKSWVDGKKAPSDQPNFGVSDALEQLYATQIAPCGFNVLRVTFNVADSKPEQAIKLSNLALWAQSKGLKIVPLLAGGEMGKPFAKDYPAKAKAFVSSVIANLKKGTPEQLAAYAQIGFYQLGYPLNTPAYHGNVDPAESAEALKGAAIEIRTAETEALSEVGMSSTQIMVPASFDIELLKNGSFAGTELSAEAYGSAFEGLKNYLGLLADSAEIGSVNIEWHPGSITSEATEKLAELVRSLLTDVQGKTLVLSTGYSTAFRSSEDQSRFYATGFANLADIRASEGIDCPFVGIIWNHVLDSSAAGANPPSDQTAQNMTQWDLGSKAAELIQLWQTGTGDPDLAWWWKRTGASFGILSLEGGFTPKQAHQVLTELQQATAQAAVDTGVADAAQKFEEVQAQAAQAQTDPMAPPVDPNTGPPIDPNTGLPIDPNNPPIDPNTGLPIDPNAAGGVPGTGSIADELKNTLNGALSQLISGIIEKGKSGLTNIIGRLLGDPSVGTPGFDPNAGFPDPGAGGAIDPNTGLPIDPNTGLPVDPNTGLPVDPNQPPAGDPSGGGAPTGIADLAIEGSAPSIGSLTTNVPINVNVTMKNNGDSPANGATAYLVDSEGNAFAASEQTTLQPGASAEAVISFTPPSAGAIPGVQVLLFCDNETNTADNSASVGSLTITDPPGGVDPGVQPDPDPGPGGGGGGTPGGLRPGKGGIIKVRPFPPGVLAGLKPKIGVSLRPPGIVPKLSLIKPGMFNIGTILPGTSAKLVQKVGSLVAGEGDAAPASIGYPVGQNVPLTVPMTNPFKRPFKNVKATMYVNGSMLTSRLMGSVMPKQTKTVSFNEFKPSAPGVYNLEVRFEAVGLRNRTQLARASCQINVLDNKEATPVVRPGVIPSAGGATVPGSGGRPTIRMPRPAFGLVPTVVKTSIVRPILFPTTIGTRPTGSPGKAMTLPVISAFTPSTRAALGVTSNDIGIRPFPPAENASVSVAVQLKNSGMAAARGVKVEAFLDGKSLKSQTLDIPAGQTASANRFDRFSAALGQHVIKAVVTHEGKSQESSRSFEVKKGVLLARPTIGIALAPSLTFTGNDIQFAPIPQPGKETSLLVNVRNPGAAPANAEFEAFVDGRSLGKVRRTIAPLQSAAVSGFTKWTAPAGNHSVKIVASMGRRQIAAEKSLNVINTIPLRTIVRPSITITRPVFTPTLPGGARPTGVTPGGVRPGGIIPGGVRPTIRPGVTGVDVGVSVADIKLSPPNPKANQDVTIHVTVHNFGNQEATGAMLGISYAVDRTAPKTLNLPITVGPGQEKTQNWKVRLAGGQKLTVAARVSHKDDKNPANSAANLSVDLGAGTPGIVPGGIRPPVIGPGGVRPPITLPGRGTPAPDMALAATDITFAPSSVKEGDTLTFTVRVRNIGQVNAQGAKLALVLNKDGALHEQREFALNANAGQTATQTYAVRVPRARQLQLQANASVAGDPNALNNQASATVNVVQSIIVRPPIGTVPPIGTTPPTTVPGRIAPLLLSPDLVLGVGSVVASARSIKVGETLRFTVKVRNGGRGLAKGAKLTLRYFVNGRAAGSQDFTFDVPAGSTVERVGQFKVPPGTTVLCTAQAAATGDTNAGNNSGSASVPIVK